MVYLLCMGVCACAIGMDYIPGEVINIEAMDYEIYKNGKDRSALCNAANKSARHRAPSPPAWWV